MSNIDFSSGFHFKWESGFSIKINIIKDTVVIKANKAGLLSLANHLKHLSEDKFADGYYFDLDQHNSLEEGSINVVVIKDLRNIISD